MTFNVVDKNVDTRLFVLGPLVAMKHTEPFEIQNCIKAVLALEDARNAIKKHKQQLQSTKRLAGGFVPGGTVVMDAGNFSERTIELLKGRLSSCGINEETVVDIANRFKQTLTPSLHRG